MRGESTRKKPANAMSVISASFNAFKTASSQESPGKITTHDMYNTFNMGVGFVIVVAKEDLPTALEVLQEEGEEAYRLGEVVSSPEKVIL